MKTPTQYDKIIKLLSDRRWHTVVEIVNLGCLSHTARLSKLKKKGYKLDDDWVENKPYKKWRLIKKPLLKTL